MLPLMFMMLLAWSIMSPSTIAAQTSLDLTAANFNVTLNAAGYSLVMFYAPWCPHCQDAKPKFKEAAAILAQETDKRLAMMDCDDKQNTKICTDLKIEGYPTIKLYKQGQFVKDYEEEVNTQSLAKFMLNPEAVAQPSPPGAGGEGGDKPEPDTPMKDVTILSGANATDFLKSNAHVLVFYYAPWCPHCVESKPKYEKAAIELKELKLTDRILAAMNCDHADNQKYCNDQKVEGFPTVRYFHNGEMFQEYEDETETKSIVDYMKSPPKEKVAPTPIDNDTQSKDGAEAGKDDAEAGKDAAEAPKDGEEKELKDEDRQPEKPGDKMEGVTYLTPENFKSELATAGQETLVMFYAPWCPHCMDAKPIFKGANDKLKQADPTKVLAAMNCDDKANEKICEDEKIEGFPTLRHYSGGKTVKDYPEAPPTVDGLVKYMTGLSKSAKDEL